jgi:hypothetical protein
MFYFLVRPFAFAWFVDGSAESGRVLPLGKV